MHYKNGRQAHEGDPVVAKHYNGSARIVAGVLHSTFPTASTCNGQIAVAIPGGSVNHCVTIGEIYHAEDAFAAVEAKLAATPPSAPTFVEQGEPGPGA
jgi:hypothetical protein